MQADRAGTPARLTVIGSATVRRAGCGQATSPARSVGPCSTHACRASRSSTSSCPGRPRASGGSSRRPRRRADSTGYWLCPHSAARGAAHLAVAAAPAPSDRLLRRPRRAPDRVRRGRPGSPPGDDARLVPPPAHPAAGPLPAGAPWLPPPPAPPRQPRAGRAGAGRAGVVAVVLVVAVVIAAAVLFAPSLLTLRNAEPAPQAPPVVVVPAPSPGDDGTSSPAPSVAPSRAAAARFRRGGERRRTDRAGPGAGRVDSGVRGDPAARGRAGPASSSTSPTARPGC